MTQRTPVTQVHYDKLIKYFTDARRRVDCVKHLELSQSAVYTMLNNLEAHNIVVVGKAANESGGHERLYMLDKEATKTKIKRFLANQMPPKVDAQDGESKRDPFKLKKLTDADIAEAVEKASNTDGCVTTVSGVDGYHTRPNRPKHIKNHQSGGSLNNVI